MVANRFDLATLSMARARAMAGDIEAEKLLLEYEEVQQLMQRVARGRQELARSQPLPVASPAPMPAAAPDSAPSDQKKSPRGRQSASDITLAALGVLVRMADEKLIDVSLSDHRLAQEIRRYAEAWRCPNADLINPSSSTVRAMAGQAKQSLGAKRG